MDVPSLSLMSNTWYENGYLIEGVRFTPRELDIIACILNGRTSKKAIGSILNISSETVTTHIRKIIQKIGCHSWEGIRDFVEKSNKADNVRQIYKELSIRSNFKKVLVELARSVKKETFCILVCFDQAKTQELPITINLLEDLKNLGIKLIIENKDIQEKLLKEYRVYFGYDRILFFTSFGLIEPFQKKFKIPIKYVDVSTEGIKTNHTYQKDDKNLWVYPTQQDTYFSFFFKILRGVFKDNSLNKKILELESNYLNLPRTYEYEFSKEDIKPSVASLYAYLKRGVQKDKKRSLLITLLIIVFLCIVIYELKLGWIMSSNNHTTATGNEFIRSSLIVPSKEALLSRSDLIEKIQKRLDNTKGIQTVSLVGVVGIGGVGKTTLARLFGRVQNFPVVYEVNAETRNSLSSSFKELAKHFAEKGTKEQKEEFDTIENIKDSNERENQMLSYVQKRLKEAKQWLLIFDNVETFSDIKEYIPQNPNIWGNGKVIITTRNNNLINSTYLESYNIIPIEELTAEEALTLFAKILYDCEPDKIHEQKRKEILSFLKNIPPFPLDVSIAASYIKTAKITFFDYLKRLRTPDKEFEALQKDLLKDSGDYTKTRYAIITQSLDKLVEAHPDFFELVLMLSLLDSQDIPREIFDRYKSKIVVDDFIYHLKKYALITDKDLSFGQSGFISIHRSTQEISLSYIKNKLTPEQNKTYLQQIAQIIENYTIERIDKEDVLMATLLINHIKTFLNHNKLINKNIKGSLLSMLGSSYYLLGYYTIAEELLGKGLTILRENPRENKNKIAQYLVYLGNSHRQRSDFKKAQALFEEILEIHQKEPLKNYEKIVRVLPYLARIYVETGNYSKAVNLSEKALEYYKGHNHEDPSIHAWILSSMGDSHREAGNYNEAKEFFEKSHNLYKTFFPTQKVNLARGLTFLANTNRSLGNYEIARDLLQESTMIYKELYGDRMPWATVHLGNTYRKLGQYKKAKDLLMKALEVYKKKFKHIYDATAWNLTHLGNLYRDLGYFKEAKEFIEEGLSLYRKTFKEDNVKVAWNLVHLGQAYKDIGEYEEARVVTEQALAIHKKHYEENHIKIGWISWCLATIYMELGDYEYANKLLDKSLKIYEAHYGIDHTETARIWRDFGILAYYQNDLENAESRLKKALSIFEKEKHPGTHLSLESLGDLYLKEATLEGIDSQKTKEFKMKALDFFSKSLNAVKEHLSEDSPRTKIIEEKIIKAKEI